jgi:hypothetical protein
MPKNAAAKDARKRTKKPVKIADLPAKSLKGKDAAAVKGGALDAFLKIDGVTGLKVDKTLGSLSTKYLKFNR